MAKRFSPVLFEKGQAWEGAWTFTRSYIDDDVVSARFTLSIRPNYSSSFFNDSAVVRGHAIIKGIETRLTEGTVTGIGEIISTYENANFFDADTATSVSSISSIDYADFYDESSSIAVAVLEAEDIFSFNDAGTVEGIAVIQSVEERLRDDEDSVVSLAQMFAFEIMECVDSETVNAIALTQGLDNLDAFDSASVSPTGIGEATDQHNSLDGVEVTASAQISALETASYLDYAFVSSTASSEAIETHHAVDANTVMSSGQASASDLFNALDSSTVTTTGQVSGQDYHWAYDANAVSGIAACSATDYLSAVDTRTVTGSAAPSGIDRRSPAIAFVAGTYTSSNSNTATVNVPAGTQNGDLMLARIFIKSSSITISTPSGWNLLRTDTVNTDVKVAIFYRTASSEPASYSWTMSSNINWHGSIESRRNVNTSVGSGGIVQHGATTASGTTSLVAPSITTTSPSGMLICTFNLAKNGTLTLPATLTSRNVRAADTISSASGDRIIAPAQTTTTQTTSSSATGNAASISIGIQQTIVT